jgi:hypothetical protein
MKMRRLSAAMLATSALVFGASVLVGSSRASSGATVSYLCSAADKQFIDTVSSNMMQLSYWSDALVHQDADPATVAQDRTLHATRDLLGSMFVEYSKAVSTSAAGRDGGIHMKSAWRLANASHKLLAGARDGLGRQGCDVSPLLTS